MLISSPVPSDVLVHHVAPYLVNPFLLRGLSRAIDQELQAVQHRWRIDWVTLLRMYPKIPFRIVAPFLDRIYLHHVPNPVRQRWAREIRRPIPLDTKEPVELTTEQVRRIDPIMVYIQRFTDATLHRIVERHWRPYNRHCSGDTTMEWFWILLWEGQRPSMAFIEHYLAHLSWDGCSDQARNNDRLTSEEKAYLLNRRNHRGPMGPGGPRGPIWTSYLRYHRRCNENRDDDEEHISEREWYTLGIHSNFYHPPIGTSRTNRRRVLDYRLPENVPIVTPPPPPGDVEGDDHPDHQYLCLQPAIDLPAEPYGSAEYDRLRSDTTAWSCCIRRRMMDIDQLELRHLNRLNYGLFLELWTHQPRVTLANYLRHERYLTSWLYDDVTEGHRRPSSRKRRKQQRQHRKRLPRGGVPTRAIMNRFPNRHHNLRYVIWAQLVLSCA